VVGAIGKARFVQWTPSVAQRTDNASFLRLFSTCQPLEEPMMSTLEGRPIVLVIVDVEETRDGVERLLNVDGYRVVPAKDEAEAVLKVRATSPNLILMSLGVDAVQLVAIAQRLRQRCDLKSGVPIVLFSVATVDEGAEVEIEPNLYLTRPDNFDQLRGLLSRLLG
jgi:chemosensory pili system protein ChpA (sensor histidine kinase/response regulator)